MKVKSMQLPRGVIIGEDTMIEINAFCAELKLSGKALVIADATTYDIAGKSVEETLTKEHPVVTHMIRDATMEEIEKVKDLILQEKPGFVVGVGGGKVIDVAKLSSKETNLEFVSVPTAASHDGIASSRASIKQDGGSVSIEAQAPLGVIADITVIKNSPYRLFAAGAADVLAKYTACMDWELAHRVRDEEVSEYAMALSRMAAQILIDSADTIKERSERSVRKVVKALISCSVAMSIAGTSRPGSGSEHKFSHALDTLAPKPALHGEQCGVGTILMMHLHGGDWERVKNALEQMGAPTTAREMGIADEHIVDALLEAQRIRPQRYTILEHSPLDRDAADKLARDTGVIG